MFKQLNSISALSIVVFAFTPNLAHSQNLVANGGFESLSVPIVANTFCASFVVNVAPLCFATEWTGTYLVGNGIGAGNGAGYSIPQPDPDGSNALIIQNGMSISQGFSASIGGEYRLSFFAANRTSLNYSGPQTIVLEIDNGATFTSTVTNIPGTWRQYTGQFTLLSGLHTITLRGLGDGTPDVAAFVDSVSISAVPELPSLISLLLGIAAISIRIRRRKHPRAA